MPDGGIPIYSPSAHDSKHAKTQSSEVHQQTQLMSRNVRFGSPRERKQLPEKLGKSFTIVAGRDGGSINNWGRISLGLSISAKNIFSSRKLLSPPGSICLSTKRLSLPRVSELCDPESTEEEQLRLTTQREYSSCKVD